MKVSVLQTNLSRAIQLASRVVGARTSLPILGNVLLTAKDSQLIVSATNLELALSISVGCKIETEGTVSIPARLLNETIQAVQSDKLQLTSGGAELEISAAHMKATLNGMAADEYPVIPEVDTKNQLTLPVQVLKDALERVVVAASLDESRPVLAGVSISSEGDGITLAATDSYRLTEEKIKLEGAPDIKIIIPIRTVQEITRLLSSAENDEVTLTLGDSEMRCEVGDVALVSRLIEGNFPNYRQIIPEKTLTTIIVARDELSQAVRLAGIFARESAHTIKLEASEGSLKLYAEASQVGTNNSDVPAQLTGEPIEISLNARFLQDVLGSYKSDQVELRFQDKLDPCLVLPVGESFEGLHLIMPLRS